MFCSFKVPTRRAFREPERQAPPFDPRSPLRMSGLRSPPPVSNGPRGGGGGGVEGGGEEGARRDGAWTVRTSACGIFLGRR